jgi:lysozyme family protein
MMDFRKCVELVLRHEGGYVNDPNDPGGETNMGISRRAFPKVDIANLTRAQAEQLYLRYYWRPSKADEVAESARALYFDTAVNCGVATAVRLLQMAAGVEADGVFGPVTAAAAKTVTRKALATERMRFYGRVIKTKPTLRRFLKGWTNRVDSYLKQ